jgi:hypothetical protein
MVRVCDDTGRRDILPALKHGASHTHHLTVRWELTVRTPTRCWLCHVAVTPISSGKRTGLGGTWLFCVGPPSVGLLFDEANTQSTASYRTVRIRWGTIGSTPRDTHGEHLGLSLTAFEQMKTALYPRPQGRGFSACIKDN